MSLKLKKISKNYNQLSLQNLLLNDLLFKKFINKLFKHDAKLKVKNQMLELLKELKFSLNEQPITYLHYVIYQIEPHIKFKPLRLGSVIFQVPNFYDPTKKHYKGIHLILEVIKQQKNISLKKKLLNEFLLILEKKSSLLQNKTNFYKRVIINKGYTHFRWS